MDQYEWRAVLISTTPGSAVNMPRMTPTRWKPAEMRSFLVLMGETMKHDPEADKVGAKEKARLVIPGRPHVVGGFVVSAEAGRRCHGVLDRFEQAAHFR